MKTKHTPGPWIYQSSPDNPLLFNVVDSPTESSILAGPFWKPNRMKPDKDIERAYADAHLIAAAPEMLDALQAIIARIEGVFDDSALLKFGPLSTDTTSDCLAIAVKAFRKGTEGS